MLNYLFNKPKLQRVGFKNLVTVGLDFESLLAHRELKDLKYS